MYNSVVNIVPADGLSLLGHLQAKFVSLEPDAI